LLPPVQVCRKLFPVQSRPGNVVPDAALHVQLHVLWGGKFLMEMWQHDHNPRVLPLTLRFLAQNYNVHYEHTAKGENNYSEGWTGVIFKYKTAVSHHIIRVYHTDSWLCLEKTDILISNSRKFTIWMTYQTFLFKVYDECYMCVNSNDINLAWILKTYNYQNISHIKCMRMHMCVCVYTWIYYT